MTTHVSPDRHSTSFGAMSVYSAVPLSLGGVQGNDIGGRSQVSCGDDRDWQAPSEAPEFFTFVLFQSPSFPSTSNGVQIGPAIIHRK